MRRISSDCGRRAVLRRRHGRRDGPKRHLYPDRRRSDVLGPQDVPGLDRLQCQVPRIPLNQRHGRGCLPHGLGIVHVQQRGSGGPGCVPRQLRPEQHLHQLRGGSGQRDLSRRDHHERGHPFRRNVRRRHERRPAGNELRNLLLHPLRHVRPDRHRRECRKFSAHRRKYGICHRPAGDGYEYLRRSPRRCGRDVHLAGKRPERSTSTPTTTPTATPTSENVAVPTTSDAGLLLFGIALAIAATALLAGRRAP